MTRPGSSEQPPKASTTARPPERRLAATAGALVAGTAAFAVLLLLGLLLYERVWGNSTGALVVIGLLFGAAGLYAGWLAAMMVFSALESPPEA